MKEYVSKIRWGMMVLPLVMALAGCQTNKVTEPAADPQDNPPPAKELKPEKAVSTAIPENNWVFERNALVFQLKAEQHLNIIEKKPHTCLVGIYQLSDPNEFNTMASTQEGLQKLLDKDSFPKVGGIVASSWRVVQPGETLDLVLDRAAKAKMIGVVAGYFNLETDKVSSIFHIPAKKVRKKGLASLNPFAKRPPPVPDVVKAWVSLGNVQINDVTAVGLSRMKKDKKRK